MCTHLTLAFARYIVRPADGEDVASSLMQWPIFRLVGQGPAWVALFFILSGFVNALKPITLAKSGNIEAALFNLAISSFRRPFRLILPATAATFISWFVTQIGAYETAKNSDAYWLHVTSPSPSKTWGRAVEDLFSAIRTTWLYAPSNPYDQPQWALIYLLQGSLFVFALLLLTVNLTPRFRVLAIVVCYFWSMNWSNQLGDRKTSTILFQQTFTNLHSHGRSQRLRRCSSSRTELFAIPPPLRSLLGVSCSTTRLRGPLPHVVPFPFSNLGALE